MFAYLLGNLCKPEEAGNKTPNESGAVAPKTGESGVLVKNYFSTIKERGKTSIPDQLPNAGSKLFDDLMNCSKWAKSNSSLLVHNFSAFEFKGFRQMKLIDWSVFGVTGSRI